MKTMQETMAAPHEATPMELALATMEMMTAGVRTAAQKNDAKGLAEALSHLVASARMVQRWISDGDPKARA